MDRRDRYSFGRDDENRDYGRDRPLSDEEAVERYRYMLRTAPPDMIERAHEEAFAKLTPQQRAMVLEELSKQIPDYERERAVGDRDQVDPRSLARMATRAEMRQPGILERTFGGMSAGGMGVGGMGIGLGGMLAGSFLSTMAGAFIGTMIADQFFNDFDADNQGAPEGQEAGEGDYAAGAEDPGGQDLGGAEQDAGTDMIDYGGDQGGLGDVGGDFGGDLGGLGDFGGGDFGGGDFGGGEF